MTTIELSSALDPQTFPEALQASLSNAKTPIENLYITKNNLNASSVHHVLQCSNIMGHLKSLLLPDNFQAKNAEDAVALLATRLSLMGPLPHLQRLDLSLNNVTSVDALCAALPKSTPALQELLLRYNSLGPAGASRVARMLPSMPMLQVLDVTGNAIGDAGAVALCDALRDPAVGVRRLVLWGNKISDASAPSLCDMLRSNRTLVSLDLTSNELTQESLEALYRVVTKENNGVIEDVSITGNPMKNRSIATRFSEFCAKRSHVKSLLMMPSSLTPPPHSSAAVVGLSSEARVFLEQPTPLVQQYQSRLQPSCEQGSSVPVIVDSEKEDSLKEQHARLEQERHEFELEKAKFRDYCNKREQELAMEREKMLKEIKLQVHQQIAQLVAEAKEKNVVLNVVFKQ